MLLSWNNRILLELGAIIITGSFKYAWVQPSWSFLCWLIHPDWRCCIWRIGSGSTKVYSWCLANNGWVFSFLVVVMCGGCGSVAIVGSQSSVSLFLTSLPGAWTPAMIVSICSLIYWLSCVTSSCWDSVCSQWISLSLSKCAVGCSALGSSSVAVAENIVRGWCSVGFGFGNKKSHVSIVIQILASISCIQSCWSPRSTIICCFIHQGPCPWWQHWVFIPIVTISVIQMICQPTLIFLAVWQKFKVIIACSVNWSHNFSGQAL